MALSLQDLWYSIHQYLWVIAGGGRVISNLENVNLTHCSSKLLHSALTTYFHSACTRSMLRRKFSKGTCPLIVSLYFQFMPCVIQVGFAGKQIQLYSVRTLCNPFLFTRLGVWFEFSRTHQCRLILCMHGWQTGLFTWTPRGVANSEETVCLNRMYCLSRLLW